MNTNDIPKAHPELLEALHRQDEQARQMKISEGFTEKIMKKVQSEESRLAWKKENSIFRKIAAIFIAAAFLGGLVWAIRPFLTSPKGEESHSPEVTAPLPLVEDNSLVLFADIRLDSMLSIVSRHYNKAVSFGDEQLKGVRIHTKWNREDSLAVFIENLNELDELQLTELRDTIFVQKGGAK